MGGPRRHLAACGIGLAAVALALGLGGTVGADTPASTMSLSFPLTTVVTGASGSIHEVTSGDVAGDMVGQSCTVTIEVDNNGSAHPNSNVIVASGGGQVVVPNVETLPGGATTGQGNLTLGTTVSVSVQLGPDGVFSGGGSVELLCSAVTPSTTSTSTTTTLAPDVEAETEAVVQAEAVSASPAFTG
jgi:hypothetical protein